MSDEPFMPIVDDEHAVEALRGLAREQADEITRLRAENERLREALRPFAESSYASLPAEPYWWNRPCGNFNWWRRARAALAESGEEER